MTDFAAVINPITSYASASGLFNAVNGHEPKNAPSQGLTAAVWVQRIIPLPGRSALNATTGLLEIMMRLYRPFLFEPPDAIDPDLMAAVDVMLTAFSGDFDLGGNVSHIDLLGAYSNGLWAQAGYLNQDSKIYRVMDISIPVVINDLWTQVA